MENKLAAHTKPVLPFVRSGLSDIGWGFVVAWGLATVFTQVFSEGDNSNLGTFWLASMAGAPAGLLVFFVVPFDVNRPHFKEMLTLFAIATMTLGLALLEISLHNTPQVFTFQAVGGFVSALGTAVFTVLWGRHYTALDMARIERMAAGSLIVAFACYGIVLLIPRILAILFIGCLPFLSALCLAVEPPPTTESKTQPSPQSSNSLGNLNVPGFIRLGLGVVGATTVVSLFWTMMNNGVMVVPAGTLSISVLSGSIVAVLIMAYLSRYARSLNLGTLYRWVLPLVSIAFSMLVFHSITLTVGAAFLINAAQALLNLTTFVYFAEIAQRTGASAIRVFGLGRFFLEAGFLIGLLAGPFALELSDCLGSYEEVLLLALTGFIVLAMISIANQDRMAFTLEEDRSNDSAVEQTANPESIEEAVREATSVPHEQDALDGFALTCAAIADEFSLTKREREILPYLAQGYSLPYIRNELYISQSTIDTHVRHIYKKMNIHSKEELITAVRSRC